MIKVNNEFLEPYIKGKKTHAAYETTKDIADHLKFHFNGYVYKETKQKGETENPYFTQLIDSRRPSESEHIKEYRRKIYLPKTKQPCFKIVNSLKKIVKSPDWNINYSKVEKPSKIREGEQLEDYCEKKLPFFGSVENWFYSYALKELLTDPNGLVCVLPIKYELESNTEFRKPYPYFVNSEHVFDYVEDEYAIFRTNKSYEYKSENGKQIFKDFVICIVTQTEVWEVKQINTKGDYELTLVLTLTFGKMPAFRIGGVFKEIIDNSSVFESFVSAILPGLDAAARETSDLDAEVVQHIFTTMWYYSSQGCGTCNGMGKVMQAGKQTVCGTCSGTGVMAKSPYKDLIVKPPAIDEQSLKPPYAGFIEKNTEIVKIQDERIFNHIFEALSAINMEFLAQTPLNQSGKAKEVDKDELNSFVYGVAYHSVGVIVKVYYYINEIRVMDLGYTEEVKSNMVPKIIIPERFEILSENYLQEQVTAAITGKIDPIIVNYLEIEFAGKKFENFEEVKNKIVTTKQLNPFPGMNPDQVDDGVLSGTITKQDAILYKYRDNFIERAFNEHEDFHEKDYKEKVKILKAYSKEKIKELSPSTEIMGAINGEQVPGMETPIDIEAEAKANLKGSVGGVQGLIGIQTAVSQGITDYEAAVTMLFEIYGFDDATSRKLLGSKEKLEAKKKQLEADKKQQQITGGRTTKAA